MLNLPFKIQEPEETLIRINCRKSYPYSKMRNAINYNKYN